MVLLADPAGQRALQWPSGYLGRLSSPKRIRFDGQELVGATDRQLRAIRGRRIAMVYQDPMSALNPVKTIGAQLAEVPLLHLGAAKKEALEMAAAMLEDVRLPDAGDMLRRYPHQLSGGQRQRVMIAMALLARPSLLLLDEPTTGLHVTVEAAVIDLIGELRRRYSTSLLFISHNLGLIAESCDRVCIPERWSRARPATYSQSAPSLHAGLIDCIPISAATSVRTLAAIPTISRSRKAKAASLRAVRALSPGCATDLTFRLRPPIGHFIALRPLAEMEPSR